VFEVRPGENDKANRMKESMLVWKNYILWEALSSDIYDPLTSTKAIILNKMFDFCPDTFPIFLTNTQLKQTRSQHRPCTKDFIRSS
jgi:hypothetical protein